MRHIMFVCTMIAAASPAYAQSGKKGEAPIGTRVAVEAEVVKGAPYSAEVVNDTVQILSDGNRLTRHTVARVYRDSEGRTRRETARRDGTMETTIQDPVAHTSWTLDSAKHTARQLQGVAILAPMDDALALKRRVAEQLTVLVNGQPQTLALPQTVLGAEESRNQSEERLASRTIEGLRVDGVRRTQTIAAGTVGNERPIVVTTDEWTSPDLKVLVLSEHRDPRTGTATYKLVNVSRAEPAISLFQVPADYAIVTSGIGVKRGVLP